ncbi:MULTISPECIES: VC2046/SO_2500 family protein [Ferrimonas]|uniref:VC2046/SO_2500 family protein n=1 Tax=Ferrimonas TaxID=44011 RepID=UPI000A04D749|nr:MULTISPECIES: VC2046/SO_2500 family protein [Ferrimonas]USD39303.1 hypothetical protein J8Z22_09520 [Ferrimonas sp. SCSIO 43195]
MFSMQVETMLVNEWQLGDSLSQAIQTERRSDFGLMLAMLSQDVCLHGEFQLPKPALPEQQDLRQRFQLPEEAALKREYQESDAGVRIASAFQRSGLSQSRLQHCLSPDALTYQGKRDHGMQVAIDNCAPSVTKAAKAYAANKPARWPLDQLLAAQRLQASAIA